MSMKSNRLTRGCRWVSLFHMLEKRGANRIGFNLKVTIIEKGENRLIELLRTNIGWGGIGGFTRDPVQEGSAVFIRISFPQRSGEDISEEVSGKIVWARRDGNFTALGVGFSAMSASSAPQLVSYLQCADQFD